MLSDYSFSLFRGMFGHFASIDSSVKYFFGCFKGLISGFWGDVHKNQAISDEIALDEMVQGGFCWKAGRIVYFKQVYFVPVVYHKIKS